MPAAHHFAGQCHDRKIVSEAFQDRIAAGPADTVEHDVAATDRRRETIRRKPRQEDAVIAGFETDGTRMRARAGL